MAVTDDMIEAGESALSDHTDKYMDGSEVVQGGAVEAIYEAMLARDLTRIDLETAAGFFVWAADKGLSLADLKEPVETMRKSLAALKSTAAKEGDRS